MPVDTMPISTQIAQDDQGSKTYLYINLEEKKKILNACPEKLKSDGRPQGTAGGILYSVNSEGEALVLLGREQKDPKKPNCSGTYSEFSGSMELDLLGKAESFMSGCIREIKEETAEVYKLSEEYMINNSIIWYQKKPNREVLMSFVPVYYVDRIKIKEARDNSTKEDCKDKDDFLWVKLDALIKSAKLGASTCNVEIEETPTSIKLRSHFQEMLSDKNFIKALEHIQETSKNKTSNNEVDKRIIESNEILNSSPDNVVSFSSKWIAQLQKERSEKRNESKEVSGTWASQTLKERSKIQENVKEAYLS